MKRIPYKFYYVFAFMLIVTVIMAENIVMKNAIMQKQQDAHTINIAGRQRMLSQKITQLCLRLLFYPKNRDTILERGILRQATTFQLAADSLKYDKRSKDVSATLHTPRLDSLLKDIKPSEDMIISLARQIATSHDVVDRSMADSLLAQQHDYLPKMENIVTEYENISNDKLAKIYALNNVFVIVALMVLLAEALFIFLPIIKKSDNYITEIKEKNQLLSKQNDSLKDSEEKFRFMAENTSDGILVYENNRIAYTSPAYDRILGYPHEKIISRTMTDIFNAIHPDDRERIRKLHQGYIAAQQQDFTYEYRTLHHDGHYIWREDNVSVIYGADGALDKAVIMTHDITKRKNHEAKRMEREQMLTSLFDATHDMIAVLDVVDIDRYRYAFFNKTYETKTGIPTNEFVGKFMHEKITGPALHALQEIYRRCIATKQPISWLLIHDYPTGRLTCDATILPIFDEAGNCIRIVASVYDLTERHGYIQAIEGQNKQLRDIGWMQSHVVRAPLAKIMGIVNLLAVKSDNVDYQRTLFPRLLASAHELDEVVREIVAKTNEVENSNKDV